MVGDGVREREGECCLKEREREIKSACVSEKERNIVGV